MRLERRLMLYGVALPVALMALALAAVGILLWHQLVDGIDHSLRAQATAESVSLFDGPMERPHFHAISSPLRSVLGHPDAAIAVYDAGGTRLEASDLERAPQRLQPPGSSEPRLRTVGGARELVLRIEGPHDEPHALWLSTSLDEERATIAAYVRYAVLGLLAFLVLLLVVQRRHARWLARRVDALADHMGRLQSGDLDADPGPDPVPDVIGRLRDAVAVATEQLRATRRARENMVAGAAHELRTPLAAMRASVDVALRRERSADELRVVLEDVREEVIRLNALATELLDLAAVGASERVVVRADLAEIARESVRRFRAEAEERGVVLQSIAEEPIECELVPDLVARAVDNLLSNALRHAPRGSSVQVEVSSDGGDRTLRVADEGPGVEPSEREAVFLPFHRLDRGGTGTGLGLALVREIAELHGGVVHVVDRTPGATFELRFPG